MLKPIIAAALVVGATSAVASTADFKLTYSQPKVTTTQIGGGVIGVETFDSRAVGVDSWTTDFGTGGLISGSFSNFNIMKADQYGGADGTGNYAGFFVGNGEGVLKLSQTSGRGLNYLGVWVSALSANNTVKFYSNGSLVGTFDTGNLFSGISGNANYGQYFGNPGGTFAGQNMGEPYAFVNFRLTKGSFDEVRFVQTSSNGGGFELDNVTVSAVPEPETWAMMILGFGLVGLAMRRRRPTVATVTA